MKKYFLLLIAAVFVCARPGMVCAENQVGDGGAVRPASGGPVAAAERPDAGKSPEDTFSFNRPSGIMEHYGPELLVAFAAALLLAAALAGYHFTVRRTLRRSRCFLSVLPGRIGVVNRAECIIYTNAGSAWGQAKRLNEIPDLNYPKMSEAVARVFETGTGITFDYEFHAVRRSISLARVPKYLFGQEAVVWFSHDNTELQNARRQAEDYAELNRLNLKKLEKTTRLWSMVVNSLPMQVFTKNAAAGYRYEFCNPALESFCGVPADEIIGKTDDELFPAEDAAVLREHDDEVMSHPDGTIFEHTVHVTSGCGERHYLRTIRRAFTDADGTRMVLAAELDITELEAERARCRELNDRLHDLLAQHSLLLDNMLACVMTWDADNEFRLTSCNKRCADLFGMSADELIGKRECDLFMDEGDAAAFLAADIDAAARGETEIIQPYSGVDGVRRIGKIYRKRLQLSGGRNWLFMVIDDMTEHETAKRAVEENAEWLRLTLNSIGDGVLATDASGRITLMNPVAERMTGTALSDAVGRPHEEVFRIVSFIDSAPMVSPVTRSLRTGNVVELANHTDLLGADGRRFHISDSASPIFNASREIIGAILVFRDVTEEYINRNQLRAALTSLEYASELSRSAVFRYDPSTGEFSGSKLLGELCRMDGRGHLCELSEWVYAEDVGHVRDALEALISGKEKTAVFDYRTGPEGQFSYFRVKCSLDESRPRAPQLVGVVQDVTELTVNIAELKEQRGIWNTVINTIPINFFAKNADDDFRYVLCNDAFSKFVGRRREDIIGRTDEELFPHQAVNDRIRRKDIEMMSSADGARINVAPVDCTGRVRHLNVITRPFVDGGGRRLLLGAASDVTDIYDMLRHQETANRCLNAFFSAEDIESAVCAVLEEVGRYSGASRVFIMKYDVEKNSKKLFFEYVAPGRGSLFADDVEISYDPADQWFKMLCADREVAIPDLAAPSASGLLGGFYRLFKDFGVCSMYGSGVQLNQKLWGDFAMTYEDGTHLRDDHEAALFQMIKHLIELLFRREYMNGQLHNALRTAQAASRAKSYFLSNVSHEIRTPLNAVIGFSELLRTGSVPEAETMKYLDSIAQSGNALLRLINDVLDLSKLETGALALTREPTDFAVLGDEVMRVFSHQAEAVGLRLEMKTAELPWLMLDRLRIRQILFNLVGNAVKFTPSGTVTLTAEYSPGDGADGTFSFSVRDTGIGISEKDRIQMMEPFVQMSGLRGTNAGKSGTGMGLAICKRLVECMGGEIDVDSELGRGSVFTVTVGSVTRCDGASDQLPVRSSAAAPAASPEAFAVLLVDDVEMNLRVMSALCRRAGLRDVAVASDGAAALAKLAERRFDLILTDMWMPGMNGAELAGAIRGDTRMCDARIVAVTADIEVHDDFQMDFFDGVMLKPVTFENLVETLRAAGLNL